MFIKHVLFKDVCINVLTIKGNRVYGEWWNLGFNNSFNIGIEAVVEIRNKEDWQFIPFRSKDCLRNENWSSLPEGIFTEVL